MNREVFAAGVQQEIDRLKQQTVKERTGGTGEWTKRERSRYGYYP